MQTTHRIAFCLVALTIAACSRSSAPPPAKPAPAPPPVVVAPPPPTPAKQPAIELIQAGGWPGSNTHRWGSRAFELREQGGAVEVRIHDKISFQGVGMRPEDMGPDRHQCTAWEPLPAGIARTAEAIRAHYQSTAKPAPPQDPRKITLPDHTFSRGVVAC